MKAKKDSYKGWGQTTLNRKHAGGFLNLLKIDSVIHLK